MSRGLINCNPLNIRHNSDKFQGERIVQTDRAFKQFNTMADGYRAGFVTLGTYLSRGINTIDEIIRSWAPPTENNTESYISNVERRSGVNRHTILSNTSGEQYIQIVAAMSYSENGVPANMADVLLGFRMQTKIIKV